ncbi:hypothetical protein Rhal01_03614 [Rubritalea halochordaticola]|uniref:DUF2911 domain-containing protein n=1 Tax=Rubritalea halochordaticola TaxID=714537 RepID=A0ABP9V421_9BACT
MKIQNQGKMLIMYTMLALVSSLYAEPLDPAIISKEPVTGAGYRLPIQKQGLGFNKKNGRIFYIPLRLDGHRNIKITIWHGHDNSGDKGFKWRLLDSTKGRELSRGFAKTEGPQSWVVRDITSLKPVLILEDADSRFKGKAPGNGFAISVSRIK